MEHKISRDPNQPRDFLDVYLAEMEKKENPNFDQEALELTCLDLFKVLHTHFSSLFSCKCKLKSRHLILTLHCLFAGRSGDNINNLALVTFSHSDSFVTFFSQVVPAFNFKLRCVLYLTRYQGVQEAAREEVRFCSSKLPLETLPSPRWSE